MATLQNRIHKLLQHGDFDPELVAAVLDLDIADVHHALRDNTFEPTGSGGSGGQPGAPYPATPDAIYPPDDPVTSFSGGWEGNASLVLLRWGNRVYLTSTSGAPDVIARYFDDGNLSGYAWFSKPFVSFPDSWQAVHDPVSEFGVASPDTVFPIRIQHVNAGVQKQIAFGYAALTQAGLVIQDTITVFVGAYGTLGGIRYEAFDDTLWDTDDQVNIWIEWGASILLPPGAIFS